MLGDPKTPTSTWKVVLIVTGVVLGLSIIGAILVILLFATLFNNLAKNANNNSPVSQSQESGTKTNVGQDVKLAEGFPTDVPIFGPSTLLASTKVDNTSYSAVAKTAQPVADVTSYYKARLTADGWVIDTNSDSDASSFLTFTKDKRTASIVVTRSDEESASEKTGFVVSITTKE